MRLEVEERCGYADTTTGHPCEHPVDPASDHCAAGHPRRSKRRIRPGAAARAHLQVVPALETVPDIDDVIVRRTPAVRPPSVNTIGEFQSGIAEATKRPPHLTHGTPEARASGHTLKIDVLLTLGSPDLKKVRRKLGARRLSRNQALAFFLTLRDGTNCCYCTAHLTDENRTLEHVVPESRGGVSDMDNLRLACDWCNHHRSNRDVEDFLSSFAFKRRKHQEMRAKTIEPYGGGYDHVGPVVRTRSPYETYRCEACQSTSKRRRLDEVPCVEVIVLQRREEAGAVESA